MPAERPGPITRGLVAAVNFYRRWISPLLPPSCRFTPSCSAYAVEALMTHGALRGTWLAFRRLLRCGPWHPGGWDPVPPRRPDRQRDPGHTVLHRDRVHQTPAEE
ncbi:MAG TPA: membrane protein insertion efficiency factor YidD [Pseudonocardiaceae bacterium]|nr:membrane protein insertion efficiency factor YidD [Pseudonocardiaceae bacterium]